MRSPSSARPGLRGVSDCPWQMLQACASSHVQVRETLDLLAGTDAVTVPQATPKSATRSSCCPVWLQKAGWYCS